MWREKIFEEIRELPIGASKLYLLELGNKKIESEEFAKLALRKFTLEDGITYIIERNEYGKPYIKNNPNLHFNISHTKDMIVCAVSEKSIGVDIETVRPTYNRIAEKFFSVKEQEYIFKSKDGQDVRFCEIWTRKEAYVKWIGKGMLMPFKSFDVIHDNRIVTIFVGKYILSVCS